MSPGTRKSSHPQGTPVFLSKRPKEGVFSSVGSCAPGEGFPNLDLLVRAEPKLTVSQRTRVRRSSEGAPCLLGGKQRLSYSSPLLPDSAPLRGSPCPQGLLWRMATTTWLLEKKGSKPSPIWSCWCPALLCPQAAGMFEVEGHRSQQRKCLWPGSYDCLLLYPPQTFLSLQVSSRSEV